MSPPTLNTQHPPVYSEYGLGRLAAGCALSIEKKTHHVDCYRAAVSICIAIVILHGVPGSGMLYKMHVPLMLAVFVEN